MNAIVVERHGGPERLEPVRRADPRPGPGELLVRVAAAGVNYIDVYQRQGLYRVSLPLVPGLEAAGEVVAVGDGTKGFRVGDVVAYAGVGGAYAELQRVPAARAVAVPAGVEPRQAAAAMLQGMTAHYLSHATFPLRPGHVCLIHAASGGTGGLLAQMATRLGARVLATVSSEAKAELARQAGAEVVIRYDREDFVERVREATGGEGVDVVYDGVGAATFERGLDALKRRGTMVLFGTASGPVEAFDLATLGAKGSLFLTRPSLDHHVADRAALERRAGDVLSWLASGALRLRIDSEWPLAQAAEAHRRLESRASAGKLLLIP